MRWDGTGWETGDGRRETGEARGERRWDGMGWDEMGWDEMGWDEMRWDGMR